MDTSLFGTPAFMTPEAQNLFVLLWLWLVKIFDNLDILTNVEIFLKKLGQESSF